MKTIFCFLLSVFFLGPWSLVPGPWSSSLFAGGPWFVDTVGNSGTPGRWPYNSSTNKWVLHWKADPGPLTDGTHYISSDQAVTDYIQPMLQNWQGVSLPPKKGEDPIPTVALDIIYDGKLQSVTDVTASNYQIFAVNPDPLHPPPTVAIFDPDGSIIKDYCLQMGGVADDCEAAKNRIVGMGKPFLDSQSKTIRSGFIFLNGRLIDGVATADNAEIDVEGFKAVIKHEFGHLLNLDHAQINADVAEGCEENGCQGGNEIPTMYPMLKTVEQYSLHRDDKVAISWVYPNQNFLEKFCIIVGEIQNEDGKGMQGINVIARNVNDPLVDARSMISGVLYAYGTDKGNYILSGIIPGEEYEVVYEELLKKYNDQPGSSFSPLGSASPNGFSPGTIAGPDGKSNVHCENGGETIEMQPLKLSLAQGKAVSGAVSSPSEAAPQEGTTSEKKGWCQLGRTRDQGPGTTDLGIFGVFSLGLILFIFRLNSRRDF